MAQFLIQRFDPDVNVDPHFDKFHIPVRKEMTVQDGLVWVFEHLDPTLSFPYTGQADPNGNTAMHINGQIRVAAHTPIVSLETWQIEIRPLPHFPVIKDLVVDLSEFWERWQKIYPFLAHFDDEPDHEHLQSPQDRARLEPWVHIPLNGAMTAANPVSSSSESFLGPEVLISAMRWILDSRDQLAWERASYLDGVFGVWRHHFTYNETVDGPLAPDPNVAVSWLRRRVLWQRLQAWLGRDGSQRRDYQLLFDKQRDRSNEEIAKKIRFVPR